MARQRVMITCWVFVAVDADAVGVIKYLRDGMHLLGASVERITFYSRSFDSFYSFYKNYCYGDFVSFVLDNIWYIAMLAN